MPYKAILVDDETDCLDVLSWQLEKYCPQIEVMARCTSGEAGIEAMEIHRPDVVFLDIQMPFMNGFQMLEKLSPWEFEVIFTTAHERYAIKAIKFSALDYLLKPILAKDLIDAVIKLDNRKKSGEPFRQDALETLFQNLKSPLRQKLAVPSKEKVEFVEIPNILYLGSEDNYTYIYLKDGRKMLVSKTLKHFEDLLEEPQFFRIHASYLINVGEIIEYKKAEGGSVILSNGAKIPIARGRREQFMKLW